MDNTYTCITKEEREQFNIQLAKQWTCISPEQWQDLKDTVIEMRDNDGILTQQETCQFLARLMEIIETQTVNSETCYNILEKRY